MEQLILKRNSKKRTIQNQLNSYKKSNQLKIMTNLQTKYNNILVSGLSNLSNLELMELFITSKVTSDSFYQSQYLYSIIESIKFLKNLLELSISINTINCLDYEGVKELGQVIKTLSNLESLKIKLKIKNYTNDENSLQKIFTALQKQQNLNLFELSLNGQSGFGMNSIGEFKTALQNFHSLTKVKLELKHIHISNGGFDELGKGLGFLKQLVSVSLSFSNCNLNEKNFGFIKCLENYKKLEYLSLDFNKIAPTKKIQEYLVQGLQSTLVLKEFYLKFLQDWKSDFNPLRVIQSLQCNQHLQICDVKSPITIPYNINEEKDVFQQSQLSELKLNLDFIEYYDAGFINFRKFLQQFTNLLVLELCLNAIDLQLIEITKNLGKALNQLSSLVKLKLIFKKHLQIHYGGAIELGKGISRLENLETLNLQFEQKNYIGFKGAESIGLSFQNLKKLIDLTLNFGNNNFIDNNGVIGLKKGFQSLKNLENLNLTIGNNNEIKNTEVKIIGEALYNLTKLQNLQLTISTQSLRYKYDIKSFYNTFQNIQNLKHLSIFFKFILSEQGLIKFSKGLNYQTNLISLEMIIQLEEDFQQGYESLAKSIANLDNLRILKLKLLNKMTDIKFNSFIKYFGNSKLRYVSFIFERKTRNLDFMIQTKLQRILKFLAHYKLNKNYETLYFDESDESDSSSSSSNSSLDSQSSLDSYTSSDSISNSQPSSDSLSASDQEI